MHTPSLRDVQGAFWRAIASVPGELASAPSLMAVAEPSTTLDAPSRLQVYADAYLWRLRDVLAEDFPRVAAVLGPERFHRLARDYLAAHPSTHPSVRHLGRHLPAHLARERALAPWLADLARLEWARIEVFDAPDAQPAGVAALTHVRPEDWPDVRFATIPALAVLRLDWPAHEIWDAVGAARPTARRTIVRVWRSADWCVYHAPLDVRAADALERVMAGQPFATVCDAFADLPPLDAAREAAGHVARWLADGIVARVG